MPLIHALTFFIAAWLNRVRGGALGGQHLPGVNDLWVAPQMAILAMVNDVPCASYLQAVVPGWSVPTLFGLCWLCWSSPAWGRWIELDGPTLARDPNWYEAAIEGASFGSKRIALCWRATLFLIPQAVVFGWPWILLGPAMVASYHVAWKLAPRDGWGVGEWIYGSAWGAAVVLAS